MLHFKLFSVAYHSCSLKLISELYHQPWSKRKKSNTWQKKKEEKNCNKEQHKKVKAPDGLLSPGSGLQSWNQFQFVWSKVFWLIAWFEFRSNCGMGMQSQGIASIRMTLIQKPGFRSLYPESRISYLWIQVLDSSLKIPDHSLDSILDNLNPFLHVRYFLLFYFFFIFYSSSYIFFFFFPIYGYIKKFSHLLRTLLIGTSIKSS